MVGEGALNVSGNANSSGESLIIEGGFNENKIKENDKEVLRSAVKDMKRLHDDFKFANYDLKKAESKIKELEEKLLLERENTQKERDEKEIVKKDAETFEFILHIREKLTEFENTLCYQFPIDDVAYQVVIQQLFPNEPNPVELRASYRFRRWIYLLHCGNPLDSQQLIRIRNQLKNDRSNYYTFALQIHRLYKVLSNDVHDSSSIGIKYINMANLPMYLRELIKKNFK